MYFGRISEDAFLRLMARSSYRRSLRLHRAVVKPSFRRRRRRGYNEKGKYKSIRAEWQIRKPYGYYTQIINRLVYSPACHKSESGVVNCKFWCSDKRKSFKNPRYYLAFPSSFSSISRAYNFSFVSCFFFRQR